MSQYSYDSQEEADYYESGAAEAEAHASDMEEFINNQFGDTPKGDKMDDFLPKGYEVPKSAGNYMKFEEGKNRFRVLSSAIVGYEWWVESNGSRKPSRVRTWDEAVQVGVDPIKPFWAFVVFNYQSKKIEILEITQKGLMNSIKALIDDDEWGTPKNYDLTVTRTGKGQETKYALTPSPAKELDQEIKTAYAETDIKLDKLFEGGDPFGGK